MVDELWCYSSIDMVRKRKIWWWQMTIMKACSAENDVGYLGTCDYF